MYSRKVTEDFPEDKEGEGTGQGIEGLRLIQ